MTELSHPEMQQAPTDASFDGHIGQVVQFIEAMRQAGRPIHTWRVVGGPAALIEKCPMKVGPGAHSGLILRKDVFVELGNPEAGSCAFPLWTNRLELVREGRITLIGPGIRESEGASLPFGQVVMVAGEGLGKQEQSALELKQFVANQVEGYMIRSAPGRLWSRVGRDVAGKGFDFEALGAALIALFKAQIPKIQAMEVLFVTSARDDVQRLEAMASAVRSIGAEFAKQAWRDKGFDPAACSVAHDCGSCSEKPDCDDIREVALMRNKTKRAKRAAAAATAGTEQRRS